MKIDLAGDIKDIRPVLTEWLAPSGIVVYSTTSSIFCNKLLYYVNQIDNQWNSTWLRTHRILRDVITGECRIPADLALGEHFLMTKRNSTVDIIDQI